ncbi:hypothetical protein [Candidatus Nanohalovita haloferacivicina]|uniref:hypothetical protein n=1 Tax=Candidatus Nanohalovita haloferacivicina TaxID=2978046 RepID=UPI00325FB5AA|nr:hypothetical protein HBNXNv_0545 [Candidatus Nanohalobia archaeon BNXNv]
MICIASLIVFSILGIFSAKYRTLAKEAFDCMIDKAVVGECDSDFEDRVKAMIITPLLGKYPWAAKFVDRYLDKIAIIFVIVFIITFLISLRALVMLYIYGSCKGPETGCAASGILEAIL